MGRNKRKPEKPQGNAVASQRSSAVEAVYRLIEDLVNDTTPQLPVDEARTLAARLSSAPPSKVGHIAYLLKTFTGGVYQLVRDASVAGLARDYFGARNVAEDPVFEILLQPTEPCSLDAGKRTYRYLAVGKDGAVVVRVNGRRGQLKERRFRIDL